MVRLSEEGAKRLQAWSAYFSFAARQHDMVQKARASVRRRHRAAAPPVNFVEESSRGFFSANRQIELPLSAVPSGDHPDEFHL
jgi:hypothetical protein